METEMKRSVWRELWLWRPHKASTAYAATAFGAVLMHQVFTYYYVRVYLDFYHIKESWFQWAQVFYMIWNAINDPLFGYCQDNCQVSIVRSRRHTILYGAPIFALSFLVPWFKWVDYEEGNWLCGIHLIVALCFYDAMFTYVLLANCCIFAESSVGSKGRIQMLRYQQVAALIGSMSVFLCESISSHLSSFAKFQACCVVIAVIAWLCMTYTGLHGTTLYDLEEITIEVTDEDIRSANHTPAGDSHNRATSESVWRLTWQILSFGNFFWFVLVNFFNEYHINFITNFNSIISDLLVPKDEVAQWMWNLYYGAIVLLPRLVLLSASSFLSTLGYFKIFQVIFLIKAFSGLLMFVCGMQYTWLFPAFLLLDSVVSHVCSYLTGLPLADIVDADRKNYKRKHPLSSMVFGTNALVTKPGISLAPMITVYFLNQYGYEAYKAGQLADQSLLKTTAFTITCLTPTVIGILQFIFWKQYAIRNSHHAKGLTAL